MNGWGEEDNDEAGIEAEQIDLEHTIRAPAGKPAAEQPSLYYGSVDEWVREYLRHVYRRPINGRGRVWAANWWAYDEAVIRLDALWRAWEYLRWDGSTGMSVWWRDHADHHMAVLMDPDGPFAGSQDTCGRGEPLPYTPPPAGMFDDERHRQRTRTY